MSSIFNRVNVRLFGLALMALSCPVWAQEAISAKAWLENMSQALHEKEYKVSVIQLQAEHISPLVYIHGKVDGQEVAFLEYLNGPPQSAVRVGDTVSFIEYQQAPYSVNAKRIPGVLPVGFASNIDRLESGYQFVLGGRSRLAGRPSQLVRFIPKDDFRYGYQVWLDMETALPLRYDLLTKDKQLLEQLLVVELLVLDKAPAILIEAKKQEWPSVVVQASSPKKVQWHFSWLPQGFTVQTSDQHRLIGNNESVEYIALSDGLANISVYISKVGESPLPEGLVTRNGLGLSAEVLGDREVVAVGKVPSETLTRIAKSLVIGAQ